MMTSWERGRENEQEGQREEQAGMNRGDLGEQVRGAAKDAAGKVEQGVNNIGDTLSGRQQDLEGTQHNYGRDVQYAANDAGRNVQNAADDLGRGVRNAADDVGRAVDRNT
jgi:uncharacterized protein YjbJ (UPF0337 family)